MQCALKLLKSYCDIWSLTINVQKTKVFLGTDEVWVVFQYTHLGVLFNYNNSFVKAIKERCAAANRAMFLLLKRSCNANAFTRCYCMVVNWGLPSEVWGFSDLELCKKFSMTLCKVTIKIK
jgi:hypothetical protein